MKGIFNFDKMIMPIFIKIIFWLAVIGSILGGIGTMLFGVISDSSNFITIITGLLVLLLGPIIVRLYAEMLIVIFKMQESLIQIRDEIREGNTNNISQSGSHLTTDRQVMYRETQEPELPTE